MSVDVPLELHVYFPLAGMRFVCNWSTCGDRGHVVVAGTEEAAAHVLDHVVRDDFRDVVFLAFLEVELVAPPPRLAVELTAAKRAEAVGTFSYEVTSRIADAVKGGVNVPGFALCTEYAALSPGGDVDDEDHHDCSRCRDRVRVVGLTEEELHDRYAALWRAEVGGAWQVRGADPDPKRSTSRACRSAPRGGRRGESGPGGRTRPRAPRRGGRVLRT